jgi:hypothetical protein
MIDMNFVYDEDLKNANVAFKDNDMPFDGFICTEIFCGPLTDPSSPDCLC